MNRPATILPMRSLRTALLGAALVAGLLPGQVAAASLAAPLTDGAGSSAAPTSSTVKLVKVADVSEPVLAIGARDGTGRLFIVSQGRPDPDPQERRRCSRSRSSTSRAPCRNGGEQGLLGLAFHPSFKTNRKFYVNYTNNSGDTVVREYRASATNPNVVATGSGRTIIRIDQPYANHNGGMLAFGRDGYLYIGMGDGGSRRRPRQPGAEREQPAGQDAPDQRQRSTRRRATT